MKTGAKNKRRGNKSFAVIKMKRRHILAVSAAIIIVAVVAILCYIKYDDNVFKVCIDPGHGGESIGASYNGDERLEKDDNLRLALLVEKELENRGVKVVMTRSTDKTVSLQKRCAVANAKKTDLFLCLHRNSLDDSSACGTEMWISSNAGETDVLLAENLLSELEKVGISQNRGIKYGFRDDSASDFYINSATDMPSCLVELGFISNSGDNRDFDKNIEEYAAAIADAAVETYNNRK